MLLTEEIKGKSRAIRVKIVKSEAYAFSSLKGGADLKYFSTSSSRASRNSCRAEYIESYYAFWQATAQQYSFLL